MMQTRRYACLICWRKALFSIYQMSLLKRSAFTCVMLEIKQCTASSHLHSPCGGDGGDFLTLRWDSLSCPLMHLMLTCFLAAQHLPLEVSKTGLSVCACACAVWSYTCVWVCTSPCPWVWRMMCDKCVESALWWETAGAGRCPCPFIFYSISFYSSAPLPLSTVVYNHGYKLMVIDWQFDFETT